MKKAIEKGKVVKGLGVFVGEFGELSVGMKVLLIVEVGVFLLLIPLGLVLLLI